MKNKKKRVRSTKKEKTYSAYYLAIILSLVMIMEGFLLGVATASSWDKAIDILDVSHAVNAVMADVAFVVEPLMDQFEYVNEFYQLSATEMTTLLDLSESDPLIFPKSVLEFYELASIELEEMLDLSENFSHFPQVAGAAIHK
jgi:hypothetical protein